MASPLGAYGVQPSIPPGPSLTAYQPSWRDRISAWMIGDSRDPVRQNLVSALTGSRGLGSTGMGLVDVTPAGIPLAVNESQNAANQGDWTGAAINAMAMIPGAKAGTKALEAGANEIRQGIRAYHGSPHDFDKFDLSKIGTGEGAQAYGHGLYFAENEGVAKGYRDGLAPGKVTNRGLSDPYAEMALEAERVAPGKITRAREIADEVHRGLLAGDDIKSFRKFVQSSDWPADEKQMYEAALKRAEQFDYVPTTGKMYQVDINAHPDEFLDWDKPLSEQPKAVQDAIRSTAVYRDKLAGHKAGYYKDPESFPGSSWTSFLMDEPALRSGGAGGPGETAGLRKFPDGGTDASVASDVLKSSGIKGIRYKDAGSRGTPEYKVSFGAGNGYSKFMNKADAEAALKQAIADGHPATMEQIGGTHNYVVFDANIIDILKKYGLAGLTAGGLGALAAAGMAPSDAQASPGLYGVGR